MNGKIGDEKMQEMQLQIDFNDNNYKSDSIPKNGRIIKRFFRELSTNVFNHSYKYYQKYFEFTGHHENPLLYGEKNLYSLFSSAIHEISPIHISEWSFNNSDVACNLNRNRVVDLYCMYKHKKLSNPINFYIELKKAWYSLNSNSNISLDNRVIVSFSELTKQLRSLKQIKPNWNNFDYVYIGLFVIHCYYTDNKEYYTIKDLFDVLHNALDKRTIQNYLISTWKLEEGMFTQWEKDKCRFISILGIPIQ